MTVIYVDTLFLLNTMVDYLLLLASARLAGEPLARLRFALGAVLGGLYAVAIFLPGMGFLARPLCRGAAAVLMVLLAFWRSRRLLRQVLIFLALACAFGGGVLAVELLGGQRLALGGGVLYSGMDLKIVLLSAAGCYGLLTLVFRGIGRHGGPSGELTRVRLTLGERQVELTGLVDTGNTLTDPATGRPVLVAEADSLEELLPPGLRPGPAELRDPAGVLERLEGEERRAYGVILLSMADGRYARAPGTSSMANGGRNIKARIQAIARFRRYPAGMALASGCVAAVLALTCLGGVSGAAEVPGGTDRGALALAQAQLNRPTTVAGALDTYAKAILCDSPVYFSMVLPEPARELAWQTGLAPYQEVELEDSPFWTLGFHWHRPAWQAEWSVMNLLPDGAGGYTGTLFFSPLSEDNTYGIVYQQVAVRPDGDFWTVEPLGELEALRLPDEGAIPAPDDHIPHITYAAETVDLRLEVDLTYFLTCSDIWVGYMSLSDGGWAGGRTFRIGGGDRPSPVPAPHAAFTSCCKRSELRVERKSGGVPYDFLSTLAVLCVPLSSDGSPAFDSFVLTAYDLPGVSGLWHAAADDSGLEGLSALSLDFVYGNQRYTCTAYPAEVTP